MRLLAAPPRQMDVGSRVVLTRTVAKAEGIKVVFGTDDVRRPTDWGFDEDHHTLVVHLAGSLHQMESEFSPGPSTAALPHVGDLWAIPAGCRYAALAQGTQVKFAEISVVADGPAGDLAARVGLRDPFLHQACVRLSTLVGTNDDLRAMALTSLLETLRLHIADAYLRPESVRSNKLEPRAFTRKQRQLLMDYIASGLAEPLVVADLSALLGISKKHFFEGFKASFGNTPWKYILSARLSRAQKLLESTEESVTAIAGATGFSSSSHFATAFVRRFGYSPTSHRHQHRQTPPASELLLPHSA